MKSLNQKRKNNKLYINIIKEIDTKLDINEILLSKKVIKETLNLEKINNDISVNILLVDSKKIKKINKKTRLIDKVTDVLSFPSIDLKKPSDFKIKLKSKRYFDTIYDFDTKSIFLGDIMINVDYVVKQSKMYCHSIKREFAFLITHSMLHLLGYDHMKKNDEKIMFDKQNKILDSLKIYR